LKGLSDGMGSLTLELVPLEVQTKQSLRPIEEGGQGLCTVISYLIISKIHIFNEERIGLKS
jgi:hypothetical protein